MIVTKDNFDFVLSRLLTSGWRSVDTETTGLKWYDNDRLFSLIIADAQDVYYLNFNPDPDHLGNLPPEDSVLLWGHFQKLRDVFANPDSHWFAHNAKFDLGMLARDGLCPAGLVHCTEVMARLIYSGFMKYNLASCVERMSKEQKKPFAKSDAVYDYVMEHKLHQSIVVTGKDKAILELRYNLVPFDIIAPYGETDGRITFELGIYQQAKIKAMIAKDPKFENLVNNEISLTKTALKMAQAGLPYDELYVKKAMAAELGKIKLIEEEYKGHTGREFVDSGVQFAEFFEGQGIAYKRTDKGNPRFDEYALEEMPDHPVVGLIKAHRGSNKKVSTYYSSFTYYGANGRIHADMRQAGTATGRVSYREPNMQNVPKEEDPSQEWLVRRCFVPPPEHCFFMPDFDQMEYRMMLDEAGEVDVIKLILGGLDVHTATAQMMGVSRREAKTINFLLLYGGGAQKLANALGVSLLRAKELKALYFAKLPHVKLWIYRTIKAAEINGYVKNWAGRVCHLPRQQAYKAPNYRIQGGGADVVKIAMNRCNTFITASGSGIEMPLQIHDELLFTMPKTDLRWAPNIVQIMEAVYPYRHLPLTVGAGHSWKSWGDKVEGLPV